MGINSSLYDDPDYPIFGPDDAYIDTPDDNLLIGTGSADKTVGFYVRGYEGTNIVAYADANGINLPAGNTFRIDGTPIGSAPNFVSLTDVPHSYTGPVFGSFKHQIDVFVIPIRLYIAALHNNALGVGLNMSRVLLPQFEVVTANTSIYENDTNRGQVDPSSLLSYLGI